MHDALLEKVILGIARLQDPSKSCGRDNHSCEYFVNECEKHGLQNLAALLSDALADARASAKKITQYRHKRVAHRDLSLRHSDTLSPGSRAEIAEVIACHQRFMQLACNSFQPDTELSWDIISHSDAESIVSVLKGYFAFQRFERDDWQKAVSMKITSFGMPSAQPQSKLTKLSMHKIVILDNATLGRLSRDFCSRAVASQAKAVEFIQRLKLGGIYVGLTTTGLMELFAHADEKVVRGRYELLEQLPCVAWIRPYDGSWFVGDFTHVLLRELHEAVHGVWRPPHEVIDIVRENVWETGTGSDMLVACSSDRFGSFSRGIHNQCSEGRSRSHH